MHIAKSGQAESLELLSWTGQAFFKSWLRPWVAGYLRSFRKNDKYIFITVDLVHLPCVKNLAI